ncbi:MAG: YigZ family protein [Bacillota bacterium]
MINEYKTLLQPGVAEIYIEKSRFIGYSAPVASEQEAVAFIGEIKARHNDAAHNVPAYVIGMGNEIQRYSDDGEPSGTAGIPILEVIKKEDLRNVVIIVTRYFGGIKLGTGGLIRAYTKGAKIAVDAAPIITKRLHKLFQVEIEYTLLGKVQNEIIQSEYIIKEVKYDHLVHFFVYVPLFKEKLFQKQLIELTNARCEMAEEGLEYLIVKK